MAHKIGDKINHWTIIDVKSLKTKSRNRNFYLVKCDCGHQQKFYRISSKLNNSKYCKKCIRHEKSKVDLVGKKFGELTVLEHVYTRSQKMQLKVLCDCGNVVLRRQASVVRGLTRTCGCMKSRNELKTIQRQAYNSHKAGARQRNLRTEITFEQFCEITKNPCVYCSTISTRKNKATGATLPVNSVDRINNEKFYKITNVQSTCFLCQYMKSDMTDKAFREHIELIQTKSHFEKSGK